MTADYLTAILKRKRAEVESLHPRAADLRAGAREVPAARPWERALRSSDRVTLIAELKRRAPSSGSLLPDMNSVSLARSYAEAGASALSVLTDSDFDGSLEDLVQARGAVSVPVLRKDFIVDPVQIWEARCAGADAVLLIVRALTAAELEGLLAVAAEAALATLVEVHDEEELDRALAVGAPVIGINNRDLGTFGTSLEVTRSLAGRVPGDRVLVAESGIESPEQVRDLGELGVDAVLVGKALVTHPQPGRLAESLARQPRRERR